jgi:DNA-binding transcriptional regulator YdaS (Cro superfamily)
MEKLRAFLNGMPVASQCEFAKRCGTTIGYLRKVLSTGGRLGEGIAIAVERESKGAVLAEHIRPDAKERFDYLRSTQPAK